MKFYKGYPVKWNDDEWNNVHDPKRQGKIVNRELGLYHGDLIYVGSLPYSTILSDTPLVVFYSKLYTNEYHNQTFGKVQTRRLDVSQLQDKENCYSIVLPEYNTWHKINTVQIIDKEYENLYV